MVKCDCGHEFEPVIEYRHRLLIGDCTVRENVERLMGGERAELVFTDPPYGVGMNIENDDLKGLEFDTFNANWIKQIPLGDNCGFVCYHSTRTFPSVLRIAVESGWEFECMLWYYVPDKFPAHSWKHWMMVSQAIMLFSFGDVLYADTHSRVPTTRWLPGRIRPPLGLAHRSIRFYLLS